MSASTNIDDLPDNDDNYNYNDTNEKVINEINNDDQDDYTEDPDTNTNTNIEEFVSNESISSFIMNNGKDSIVVFFLVLLTTNKDFQRFIGKIPLFGNLDSIIIGVFLSIISAFLFLIIKYFME